MITPLPLQGLLLLEPRRHGDERGFFSQTYTRSELAKAGFEEEFVQDNHSYTRRAGTVRGLHFQRPPHAQAKLVRVARGRVFDVVVDLRAGSPSYGRHHALELSADNWRQILVPEGFAHGFMTLTDDCEVLYKVTRPYAPEHEGGLLWSDPELGVEWPLASVEARANARDLGWPRLRDVGEAFPQEK
jgi:dTDP-4-dehydrorhamnose 3,5-epimerase